MNRIHRWLCSSAVWRMALERRLLPWAFKDLVLGEDVLEIGPGPGLTTDILRKRVARVTAVEIDPVLASSLKSRMTATNVNVVQGDATRIPFRDQTFSAAVSFTMLHHVPSVSLQDQLLEEVYRVLRPDGIFAGIDNCDSLPLRLIHIGDTMVTVDPRTFAPRLKTAGFCDVSMDQIRGRFRFRARRPGFARRGCH